MTQADVAAWISAIVGVLALLVAIASYRKSQQNATSIRRLQSVVTNIAQFAIHTPSISTGGGGGGGPGVRGGDGGSVVYQPNQSGNAR